MGRAPSACELEVGNRHAPLRCSAMSCLPSARSTRKALGRQPTALQRTGACRLPIASSQALGAKLGALSCGPRPPLAALGPSFRAPSRGLPSHASHAT